MLIKIYLHRIKVKLFQQKTEIVGNVKTNQDIM